MKTRIISGLAMVPLLAIFYFGGYVLFIGVFILALMALKEFYDGFRAMDVKPAYFIGCLSAVGLYAIGLFRLDTKWYLLWIFLTIVLAALYHFNLDNRKLEDALATITGVFYIVFFSYHLVLVDQTGEYRLMVWLVIFSAFGTDIMAYFTGVLMGKHKLCPKISPKKTIEGSIGGILGSVILCGLFGWFFMHPYFIHCVIIGVLGGVFSQIGDLTASIFKRKMGIKDYGNLIPGHGGVLDRIDSILFTAPMVFYYIAFIIC